VKKVRRLAVERNTTLTALVRDSLTQLAAREDLRTEDIISQLAECFEAEDVVVGPKTWSRGDLHAR
jgi:hypothetical protein